MPGFYSLCVWLSLRRPPVVGLSLKGCQNTPFQFKFKLRWSSDKSNQASQQQHQLIGRIGSTNVRGVQCQRWLRDFAVDRKQPPPGPLSWSKHLDCKACQIVCTMGSSSTYFEALTFSLHFNPFCSRGAALAHI